MEQVLETVKRGWPRVLTPSQALLGSMAEWFEAQYDDLRRFGYALSGDWNAADDLVQEAFVRICRRPRRIQRDGFTPYARRTMINLWRSTLVRTRMERRALSVAERDVAPDHADHAGQDHVWQAIMGLSPQQRAIVALRYYEDLGEAEIAATLGITPGAVKKQLNRAKSKMRSVLGEE